MVEEGIRPFKFHGLDVSNSKGKEVSTDCPFCGKSGKLSINKETSKWRCLVCGESGNGQTFIQKFYSLLTEEIYDYSQLEEERGVPEYILKLYGFVKNPYNNRWLIPGRNDKGEVVQLYKWTKIEGKNRFLATPTLSHGMFSCGDLSFKDEVHLCEGVWDAMSLFQQLEHIREHEGILVSCKKDHRDRKTSQVCVIGLPGCNVFNKSWAEAMFQKDVTVMFDNDHPKKHPKTGKRVDPAAITGAKRISSMLDSQANYLGVLLWGGEGEDHNPDEKDGYDLRDFFNDDGSVHELYDMYCYPMPEEWVEQQSQTESSTIKTCSDWNLLTAQWRKAMSWSDGLDLGLSVMLASVVSTDIIGDQLWVKIIGPASCGKSTLCEAVSSNRQHVLAKSTIRGFHSGFRATRGDDSEDNSLLAQVDNKTLVVKDGDTLMSQPNLGQILSEARDIYDRVSRTHYRNAVSKEYNVNMTWILCGTASLRSIDQSELGERFLDCVIMDGIDDGMEDEVLLKVAQRVDANMSKKTDSEDKEGGADDKEYKLAKQLTGGYVDYLRKNSVKLLGAVSTPQETLKLITRIGKFVAYMRARPSQKQNETAEREFAARLVSQHLRLAKCLAAVLGKTEVDAEVVRRVRQVALDTARGLTLDICIALWESEVELNPKSLSLIANIKETEVRKLLTFLKAIGFVRLKSSKRKAKRSTVRTRYWQLSPVGEQLFEEVYDHLKE